MKNTMVRSGVRGTIAVGCITMLSACREPAAPPPAEPPVAKLITVAGDAQRRSGEYPGTVRAMEDIMLSFLVPGKITTLAVKEGQELQSDGFVARLDDREYRSAVAEAQAQYTLQQTQFVSSKRLYDEGVISKDEFDQKRRDVDVAKSKLERAQKELEDTVLKAPRAGHVARRYVEQGQNVLAKQDVILLQDISNLKVVVSVPEADIVEGQPAKLEQAIERIRATATLSAKPDTAFALTLEEFSTSADPDTRTYTVTFTMPNPTNLMVMPGMTASVRLPESGLRDGMGAIEVPATAVWSDAAGTSCVWVVNGKTMTVQRRVVTLGRVHADVVRIVNGLAAGETIVATGVNLLTDGQIVRKYGN